MSDEPEDADLEAAAEQAGLIYTSDAEPGIRRRRRGRGFSYTGPDGDPVRATATLDRIRRLAVPPAYTDVWICRDARGHLQATGRDDRHRKQYRYHPRWSSVRDTAKFAQLGPFGETLADLRAAIDADLRRPGLPAEKVVALVIGLLDETLIRVGNPVYARTNGSYGLTTLRPKHVKSAGAGIELRFVGKSGFEQVRRVEDPRLARLVRRCHELGGKELFSFRGEDGDLRRVGSEDVNERLRDLTGLDVTAKHFRTWGATALVLEGLAEAGPPDSDTDAQRALLAAIDVAADELGNTRAVCRRSYVHPVLGDAHVDGRLHDVWERSRSGRWLDRHESALAKLLV